MEWQPHFLPFPIFLRVNYCNQLLDTARLAFFDDVGVRFAVMGFERRLLDWSNLLGVFAPNGRSLDELLDPSRQELRDTISFYLKLLERHLTATVSPSMNGNSPPVNDVSKFPFRGIEIALNGLEHLASALLYATEAGLYRRIAAYQQVHGDEMLERIVNLVVQIRYPAAQPRAPREAQFPRSWTVGLHSSPSPPRRNDQKAASSREVPLAGLSKALVDTVLYRHYRLLLGKTERMEQFYSDPSLAAWRLPQKVAPEGSEIAHGASPSDIGSCITKSTRCFPWQDVFHADGRDHRCQICDKKYTGELESSAQKRHFFQDIKPFPCIHQSCLKGNLRFFSSRREWKNHMRGAHSSNWVEYLQQELLWRCSVCDKASPTAYASRDLMYEALLQHLRACHAMGADHPISRAAAHDCVPLCRPADMCPICGACYTPRIDQVCGSDRVPSLDDAPGSDQLSDSDPVCDSPQPYTSLFSETNSLKDSAREKTKDCIADHLESLAFFFTSRTLNYPMPLATVELIFSNTSQSSSQEQIAPLEFPIQFRDPPLRPSVDYSPDSQCASSDGEEQECVATNESKVLADWENNSWFLEYKIYESEKLNSAHELFADDGDRERNWAPVGSIGALLHATYGLLLLRICSDMISKSRQGGTKRKLSEGVESYRSLHRLRLAVKQMTGDSAKAEDDGGGFQAVCEATEAAHKMYVALEDASRQHPPDRGSSRDRYQTETEALQRNMLFNLGLLFRANIHCAGHVWDSCRLQEWADIVRQVVAVGKFNNSPIDEWLEQVQNRLLEAVEVSQGHST